MMAPFAPPPDNLVRSLGYVVHTFASAEEFLRSPHLNDTSCVIADVRMPAMSGLELQAHLLAQGHRLPFIFITAFSVESDRDAGAEGRGDLLPDQALRRGGLDRHASKPPWKEQARQRANDPIGLALRKAATAIRKDDLAKHLDKLKRTGTGARLGASSPLEITRRREKQHTI